MMKYTSPNGYTGILYGKSSFSIRDSNDKEVFHTGSRSFHTMEELKDRVDNHPAFIKMLSGTEEEDNKWQTSFSE